MATLFNHALAGLFGGWIRTAVSPDALRWGLGISFLAIAAWAIKPDKLEEKGPPLGRYGVFAVTCAAFFLAEIGDKTQLATVALAARFDNLVAVVAGTTAEIPVKAIRHIAAALFAAMGIGALAGFRFA